MKVSARIIYSKLTLHVTKLITQKTLAKRCTTKFPHNQPFMKPSLFYFISGPAAAVALAEEIKAPMSETKESYLFEEDEDIERMYQFDPAFGGKWMLFVELDDMDSMRKRACQLYRLWQFHGITSIKSTTAKNKPLGCVSDLGVISFHCGPSNDKDRMMNYWQNIVDTLHFASRGKHIS